MSFLTIRVQVNSQKFWGYYALDRALTGTIRPGEHAQAGRAHGWLICTRVPTGTLSGFSVALTNVRVPFGKTS